MDESSLSFVAGQPESGARDLTPVDSDLASWLMMSGDLLGSSHHYGGPMDGDPLFPYEEPFPRPHSHGSGGATTAPKKAHAGSSSSSYATGTSSSPSNKRGRSKKAQEQLPPPARIKSEGSLSVGTNSAPPSPSSKAAANKSLDDDELDNLTPAQKRQRRLEKNREIARNCRKRKREKYQKMEEELIKLRQYNKQLEKQLNKGRDGRDREVNRKHELTHMLTLLEKKCTEAEMKGPLTSYKEMYSDFGRERQAAISFHMSQLKSLLIPNTVSKMTLWSLQQEDEFYDEKKNQKTFGGGIWNMLTNELRFTDEQKRTLLGMRHGIRTQRRNVAECLRILKELEGRVGSNFESMAKQMDMVMSTITPTQQAKFLLWIEKNKACTFMLNNMWNHEKNEDDNKSFDTNTDDEFDDSASTMGMSTTSSTSSQKGGSGKK